MASPQTVFILPEIARYDAWLFGKVGWKHLVKIRGDHCMPNLREVVHGGGWDHKPIGPEKQ